MKTIVIPGQIHEVPNWVYWIYTWMYNNQIVVSVIILLFIFMTAIIIAWKMIERRER